MENPGLPVYHNDSVGIYSPWLSQAPAPETKSLIQP